MSAICWNGQNHRVTAPAAITTAEIRKAATSPPPGDDAPDRGPDPELAMPRSNSLWAVHSRLIGLPSAAKANLVHEKEAG